MFSYCLFFKKITSIANDHFMLIEILRYSLVLLDDELAALFMAASLCGRNVALHTVLPH